MRKISVVVTTFLALSCLSANTFANERGSHGVGNGGDVFDVGAPGSGYQVFDVMEYGQPFDPAVLPAFQKIREQLSALSTLAPRTADFLEHMMLRSTLWYFVEPELKDVPATGTTTLALTYGKVQAAISSPGTFTVQINLPIWKRLDVMGQAYLLMHETLWMAELSSQAYRYVNPDVVFSAREIRSRDTLDGLIYRFDGRDIAISGSFDGMDSFCREHVEICKRLVEVQSRLVNLEDISTTSEKIRRLTGILMNPLILDPRRFDLGFLKDVVLQGSGVVNRRTGPLVNADNCFSVRGIRGPVCPKDPERSQIHLGGWNVASIYHRVGLRAGEEIVTRKQTPLAVLIELDSMRLK